MRYNCDEIQNRIGIIANFCQEDYPVDNMSELMRRSQVVLSHLAETPKLTDDAKFIKDTKALDLIDDNPEIKTTELRIRCSHEEALVKLCESTASMLSRTSSHLQTIISGQKEEKFVNYMGSRSNH